jgi:predicted nucleotidyltransferase
MPPVLHHADDPVVDALRRALTGRQEVHLALLFGSRARALGRGERPGPDRDADLAVRAAPGTDLIALAVELTLAAGVEVDVVDLSEPGYPLLNAIVRDGILIHEGQPGAEWRWRSRSISELELDRPWFERMRDAYLKKLAAEARS